jgi:dTDP-4-amino-4,6-dideoxygalactose transaminase
MSQQNIESIPVLRPRLPVADSILPYLRRIDSSGIYSNYGPLAREFAGRLAGYVAAKGKEGDITPAVLTCNGTSAIEVALRVRALPKRRYCLMPAYTFIATAHAVVNAGLEPYLLDVDAQTLALTPAIAMAALPSLPELPAAVVVVSAFGAPPAIDDWERFEQQTGIPVVFDAAAAVTSLEKVGAQPLCVSLHATKVLGIGEGGAILSSDADFQKHAESLTGFGFSGAERKSVYRGGNYRPSEYTAAVGLAVLDAIDRKLALLKSIADIYVEGCAAMHLRLQEGVGTGWQTMTFNVILAPDAVESTLARLDEQKIEWRRWWGFGCHTHPAFSKVATGDLSTTTAIAPCVIGLPFFDRITPAQQHKVLEAL